MYRLLVTLLLLIPQDTLQVKVSLVSVGVRVTDSRGRSITGLKAQDFTVFDDGSPQKIEFFSGEDQPVTMGILLDHSFSMSYNAKLDRAKEAAQALVRAAHQGSEYFYFPFDENVTLAADFTNDPEQVQSAIRQTAIGGGTSLYDAVIQGVTFTSKARLPRQVLVIISDGADQHSKHRLKEALDAVRESEIQIYTIGYFDVEEERQFRLAPTVTLADGREIDNPRIVLEKLAQESGGAAFFPRTDAELVRAVDDITNDVRTQYTLAFYPGSSASERYHQLKVAVRGGRYTVRARPGYGTRPITPTPERRDNSLAYESKVDHRNGRVFYRDDFSDPDSGWPNRQSAKYTSDGYLLSGNNALAVNGPAFSDFRASVSIAIPPGGFKAGLIFRQTEQDYYILGVFPGTPGYLAAYQISASGTKELDRWNLISTATLHFKLEVHCQKSECAVYQEGSLRGRLKKLTLLRGRIGLTVIEKGEALFHDLDVEEID
ncbi:MAG TPA: VWA domain-containing protein [Terriglobia bacterium]|jgi:Ca-activated chloride channel family protein